ncbi:MAG: hypothetical protein EBU66_19270 [Bacteroidetes bacterium]|nr:hypothetical protein [bacterium]NBP66775.1 hypothetical protein [Bacteroidota bacterium]
MMSFILGLIARASSYSSYSVSGAAAAAPVALGRWGIHYDPRIIDRKIIQANEDHCGCCVDVVVGDGMKKTESEPETEAVKKSSSSSVVRYEKREEYLLPYVM